MNPYSSLPRSAYWKTGVAQENPHAIEGIYSKKFVISSKEKIATAGSCFAQHISRHLKMNGYKVLEAEPPPPGLPDHLHTRYGYSMYSGRYGNIYTVKQLLQLTQEALGDYKPKDIIWEKDGKYFDALRPNLEPDGFPSKEEVNRQREYHINRNVEIFKQMDVFIFTLGLTEMWAHKKFGTVYPTAPGTIAGIFNDEIHEFKNADYDDIIQDYNAFEATLKKIRNGKECKIILTVSPVPLTATASGKHVLSATSHSKAILRAVAGYLSETHSHIDYFPSYEIVNNPRLHSSSFEANLRSVRNESVEIVMKQFFNEHPPIIRTKEGKHKTTNRKRTQEIQCEEALLEVFGR